MTLDEGGVTGAVVAVVAETGAVVAVVAETGAVVAVVAETDSAVAVVAATDVVVAVAEAVAAEQWRQSCPWPSSWRPCGAKRFVPREPATTMPLEPLLVNAEQSKPK